MKKLLVFLLVGISFWACSQKPNSKSKRHKIEEKQHFKVEKSEAEWKKVLSPEAYHVLRNKGTERPYTNKFFDFDEQGVYKCAGCGFKLFSSDTKFACPTGWPSYWEPLNNKSIVTQIDKSHGMVRTEVMCANCGGHLGHVFKDGPEPTGLRYCINSVSLKFEKKDK